MKKILVIKLSALGDMILATSAFKAIRAHHPDDHITLMTTAPFVHLAEQMRLFNEIVIDQRPKFYQISKILKTLNFFQKSGFSRVYDLQLVDRTNGYFYLLGHHRKTVEWIGSAKAASHSYRDPKMYQTYIQDRFRQLLYPAGILDLPPLDVRFLATDCASFQRPENRYAVLVPGASDAHQGRKRWPLARYADLAQHLWQHQGLTPVVVGGGGENNAEILKKCPHAIDLTGKTSITDIINVMKDATLAIGNDTGPMQIAGACQIPVVTLFAGMHNPQVVGPRGSCYLHIQKENLNDLSVADVIEKLDEFMEKNAKV